MPKAKGIAVPTAIYVPTAEFSEFLRLRAEKASVQKRIDALLERWELDNDLPIASEVRKPAEIEIRGLSGDQLGKVTVYLIPAHQRGDAWARKIS